MKQADLKKIIAEELKRLLEAMPLPLDDEGEDRFSPEQREQDRRLANPELYYGDEEGSSAPVGGVSISYKLYPHGKDYWVLEASSPPINLDNPTRNDVEIARDLVDTIEAHEESHRVEFDDEALYNDARQLARLAAAGATAERGRRRAREQGTTNIDTSSFGQSLRSAAEED